ncbi:MAG TPA: methylated-DNA--[protein]-cysteine S-methyltransferase [Enhygromyxa sp.]|nr:methylated-DNA--[protein]-cysteine S-methyltransferase [Enhygromyxa sp.]
MNRTFVHLDVASPLGQLRIVAHDRVIVAIHLPDRANAAIPASQPDSRHSILREAAAQLDAWFAGRRKTFALPIAPIGTDFQKSVWSALERIPFGQTRSYVQLAVGLGRPRASRAVGAANGRNPIPIIVPCHRVIGSDGSLTGYAGGLAAKRLLLDHEAALAGD